MNRLRVGQHDNINLLWAELMLEALFRQGVRDVAIAPGSRSAPLAMALHAHPQLQAHSHYDERALGFVALGLSKASQRPVAIITTSGTAVANLLPAVIEAAQTGVALIVLSADRPPELLHCGANQAIDQIELFGGYVCHFAHLPVPSLSLPAAALLQQVDAAVTQQRLQCKPVHLNCMYREPLYPSSSQPQFDAWLEPIYGWLTAPSSAPTHVATDSNPAIADWPAWQQQRGVLVAGALSTAQAAQLSDWAKTLGWPLLADCQSQLRSQPNALPNAELGLHHPKLRALLQQAEVILVLGSRLIGKRLLQALETSPATLCHLQFSPQDKLPLRRTHHHWRGGAADWCQLHPVTTPSADRDGYRASATLQSWLEAHPLLQQFNELAICHRLARNLNASHGWMVGNSLPIRLVEWFAGACPAPLYTNRGASGIDGLLATAVGLSKALQQPLCLQLGDMSLLHDIGSLRLLQQLDTPLVVVVHNNGGGNIFQLLPVPDSASLRRDYFELPVDVDLAALCHGFGLRYQQPESLDAFEQQLLNALSSRGATLLECRFANGQARQCIEQLQHEVAQLPLV